MKTISSLALSHDWVRSMGENFKNNKHFLSDKLDGEVADYKFRNMLH